MSTGLRFLQQARRISQTAYERLRPIPNEQLIWKANENDPTKHTMSHEGLFYMLPPEDQIQRIFGYPSPYDIETTRFYNTIGMMPLMVRQPTLTAKDYIEKINPDLENVRILFYGDKGRGKTHVLTHLLHYLHVKKDYFIIHIREMKKFTRSPWDYNPSASRAGRFDTPLNAALQLRQFKIQNADLIETHKDVLICKRDYEWSSRETTKAGESIFNIADHGVSRVNHASDCVAVLFKELMEYADEGKIKLASVLDNVRFLFLRQCGVLLSPDRKRILVDEMTVARAIKKLIKGNYKNSLVLATCDDKLSSKQNQTPQEVLGQEGWDHFDPFLPISVPIYTRKEFESCMNFYQDIGWLARPVSRTIEARDEIRFVSGMNPGQVYDLCRTI